jgi:NTE family protein
MAPTGNSGPTRIAIACQGGGSHTAFTAGVLQGMLEGLPDNVEVVALSGTSGGAICAALAWDGLVRREPMRAIGKLREFWNATAATELWDQLLNQSLMTATSLRDLMVMPEVSPYHSMGARWAEEHFREILENHFDFPLLRELARRPGAPSLQIGAVEVLTGHFELFTGEEISADCLLASAAIPEIYRAVTVEGRGVYWDGLFSQNPPIHNLVEHNIDEIWLIQINMSTCPRVPTETHEILDRRNSLAGNLSMEQELGFIETINRVIAQGKLTDSGLRPIRVSRIMLDRELNYRSKLDRRRGFLDELREYGHTKWRRFVRERQSRQTESSALRPPPPAAYPG